MVGITVDVEHVELLETVQTSTAGGCQYGKEPLGSCTTPSVVNCSIVDCLERFYTKMAVVVDRRGTCRIKIWKCKAVSMTCITGSRIANFSPCCTPFLPGQ